MYTKMSLQKILENLENFNINLKPMNSKTKLLCALGTTASGLALSYGAGLFCGYVGSVPDQEIIDLIGTVFGVCTGYYLVLAIPEHSLPLSVTNVVMLIPVVGGLLGYNKSKVAFNNGYIDGLRLRNSASQGVQ